ncbi:hypothetical protein [Streptomyces sp. NPDC046759]|uniref:hypothetical protein n=1 Tax=Streptomyces sp. NPDC046759 TaxID=3155019 RepID=UPI0033E78B0B
MDVHAARWGTLARLIATVGQGSAPYGVALDENTLLEVVGAQARVAGLGRAHVVRPGGDAGVLVRSFGPGEGFAVG